MNHTLYRFFDEDGKLLYVGRTMDPAKRLAKHRLLKPFWLHTARIEMQRYSDAAASRLLRLRLSGRKSRSTTFTITATASGRLTLASRPARSAITVSSSTRRFARAVASTCEMNFPAAWTSVPMPSASQMVNAPSACS